MLGRLTARFFMGTYTGAASPFALMPLSPFTSFAIHSLGTPYLACADEGNSGKATVMKFTGGSWQLVGIAVFSAGGAAFTSLAINPFDTLYVAYKDSVNGIKANGDV